MPVLSCLAVFGLILTCAQGTSYGQTFQLPLSGLEPTNPFEPMQMPMPSASATLFGLTITVTSTEPGGIVDVLFAAGPGQAQLQGPRVVSARPSTTSFGGTPIRFDFSRPITEIEFTHYDQGGDDDGLVRIQSFDSSGMPLSTLFSPHGTSFGVRTGILDFPTGASSFVLDTSGALNPNSLEYSISSVTTVPEPTCGLAISGMLLIAGVFRRRRQVSG